MTVFGGAAYVRTRSLRPTGSDPICPPCALPLAVILRKQRSLLLTKDLLFSQGRWASRVAGSLSKKGDPSVGRNRLPQDDKRGRGEALWGGVRDTLRRSSSRTLQVSGPQVRTGVDAWWAFVCEGRRAGPAFLLASA